MSRKIAVLDVIERRSVIATVSGRRYSGLWTTKPTSGWTGPPEKTRTLL